MYVSMKQEDDLFDKSVNFPARSVLDNFVYGFMMIVIDFGTFQIVFCFVVGLVWGVAYLIFRGLGFRWHGVAISRTETELDEEGSIKVFTLWHFGLVSSVTIVLFCSET